ncbi:hypothetical protein MC885_008304, partial [Smutsia gigantea]
EPRQNPPPRPAPLAPRPSPRVPPAARSPRPASRAREPAPSLPAPPYQRGLPLASQAAFPCWAGPGSPLPPQSGVPASRRFAAARPAGGRSRARWAAAGQSGRAAGGAMVGKLRTRRSVCARYRRR